MKRISPFPSGRSFRLLFLGLLFLLAGNRESFARNATIEEFIVTNSSTDLLVFFTVRNAFTREMEEGIRNGIPVIFTFQVELSRKRRIWPGKGIVSHAVAQTLSYDNLKEEYSVQRQGSLAPVLRTRSLAEAKKAMSQVNGMAVLPLAVLVPEAEYLLRVKARLDEKTLPFSFHYLIPFWNLWNFETDWYSVEFRY
jgi:hypothetical protein